MVITNLGFEFGKVLYRERWTRSMICEWNHLTAGNLSRLLHKQMPTPQLVEILDQLGYDVEVRFVPKDGGSLDQRAIFKATEGNSSSLGTKTRGGEEKA